MQHGIMFGVSFAHSHIVVIWSVVVMLEGNRVRRNEAHVHLRTLHFALTAVIVVIIEAAAPPSFNVIV
jgi:hypothetical protein